MEMRHSWRKAEDEVTGLRAEALNLSGREAGVCGTVCRRCFVVSWLLAPYHLPAERDKPADACALHVWCRSHPELGGSFGGATASPGRGAGLRPSAPVILYSPQVRYTGARAVPCHGRESISLLKAAEVACRMHVS